MAPCLQQLECLSPGIKVVEIGMSMLPLMRGPTGGFVLHVPTILGSMSRVPITAQPHWIPVLRDRLSNSDSILARLSDHKHHEATELLLDKSVNIFYTRVIC